MNVFKNVKINSSLFAALSLLATFGVGGNAHAFGKSSGGYKFTGIDGQLTLIDSLAPVVLRDASGQPLSLSNTSVRVRLSDKSQDITFMRNKDEAIAVPILGGFPGGDLRNFDLQASVIGQDYSIRGISTERTVYDNPFVHTRSCQFQCGSRIVVDNPTGSGSTGDSRTPPPSHSEPVYCQSLEEISSVTSHWSRTFEMQFLAQDGSERAVFQGIADSSTSTNDTIIRSCGSFPTNTAPN